MNKSMELAREFSDFLNKEYLKWKEREWSKRRNRNTTQNDWAKFLGISPTTLSPLMTGVRPPNEKNADLLAAALGPEVYTILQKAPRMPVDPGLRLIAGVWHVLDKDDRATLTELARSLAEEDKNTDDPKAPSRVASAATV